MGAQETSYVRIYTHAHTTEHTVDRRQASHSLENGAQELEWIVSCDIRIQQQ